MGNYGAEPHPDIPRAQVVVRNSKLLNDQPVLSDEWNVDSANRVSSYADGTNRIKFKVKYDPHEIPLT